MTQILQWLFPSITLAILVCIPLYAGLRRGRFYAIFSGIILAFSALGAIGVYLRLGDWLPVPILIPVQLIFLYAMGATGVHYALLATPRLRGRPYRWLISLPGQVFLASNFTATLFLALLLLVRGPLYLLGADHLLAWLAPLDALPYVVCVLAALTSNRPRHETVRLQIGSSPTADFARVPKQRARSESATSERSRPLRVVQISDSHLGPWQSVTRLRTLVERLANHDPDLVLLTGDFLTMESNATPGALANALSPLARLPGRCFAIFGNHDHEAPEEVRAGLSANGIELLVDESRVTQTPIGSVQIVGADYVRKDRPEHLAGLLNEHPRLPGHPRLLLLHDPSGFHDLPEDDVDLVLAGHTHGGQVGLVSLGIDWTVLSHSRWPDHGHFARGRSHLYVHRGTGFYGFPLRIGVPGEASLLEIDFGATGTP